MAVFELVIALLFVGAMLAAFARRVEDHILILALSRAQRSRRCPVCRA